MKIPFNQRLQQAMAEKKSRLCIGLDLDPNQSSPLHTSDLKSLENAANEIVEATWRAVWGYKLNFAFFEHFGAAGYAWLERLASNIGSRALIIGDGKRGDIGNSARLYARAIFTHLGLDAATVNPYMGWDSLAPFVSDPEKGVFVLCLTSNPGADDLQRGEGKLYLKVAAWARDMNSSGNVGLVVGATHTEEIGEIRQTAPTLPLLIPGVGAQGGDLERAVRAGNIEAPAIIAVSRGVLYAGAGGMDDITRAVDEYNLRIEKLAAINHD